MTMKGPYRDFFPVGAQRVRLRLPGGVRAERARLLVGDKEVAMEKTADGMVFTVPSILDHEVVAIDL